MRGYYETLAEIYGRRFTVPQARLLGYGGITYIAGVLGCLVKTIERAANELDGPPNDPAAGRIRAVGGGRKKDRIRKAAYVEPEFFWEYYNGE